MDTTLVVGATGQLGLATINELLACGRSVRALIRNPDSAPHFNSIGVETVLGDLTIRDSLDSACRGISSIVATANSAVPSRKTDTFSSVEGNGYRNLIAAAVQAKVSRFVYTSVRFPVATPLSLFFKLKQQNAKLIKESGMDHVIFEADIFMDVAFAMMGSRIPLRNANNPTILRPFKFARNFFHKIENSIETDRVARIPGDGTTRHAFICVADVARFHAAAAIGGPSGIFPLAGPEALTYVDIVRIYEKLLGCNLKISKTPKLVFRILSTVLQPFNPAGANLMWLNYLSSTENTLPALATSKAFNIELTTAETFLREKVLAIPAQI